MQKKTKEILINFAKKKPNIPNITIDNAIIERVPSAKVLGVIISDDLTWNAHLDHIAKKANKRLYMLLRCKRAGVAKKDMLGIYLALIRPVLEYCCVVWHTTLPKYLHNFLEAIQKRAVRLICGTEPSYDECLQELNLSSLYDRRENICRQFFREIVKPEHRLHDLLPPPSSRRKSPRSAHLIDIPRARTNRFKNSFIPYAISHFQ
jgi:hypothetical protein